MSFFGELAKYLKQKQDKSKYEDTVTEGEYLNDPDIYIKYVGDGVRLLFTNSNNEWSEFEALYPEEREKYIRDLNKIVIHLSSLHDHLAKYGSNQIEKS